MPFSLPLPPGVPEGWKVKIRDKERLEPPHVTIIFKTHVWRLNLRTETWMDGPASPGINTRVQKAVEGNLDRLRAEWNNLYPNNPV